MTVHINRRLLIVIALAVAIIGGLTFGAKSYADGQSSDRAALLDHAAKDRTDAAALAAVRQKAAVEAAVKEAEKKAHAHLKATTKRIRATLAKRADRLADEAQASGYSSGNAAGYSSGNAAGYSSGNADGHEEGVEEGIETASDELSCSDDSDVDLPACDDY